MSARAQRCTFAGIVPIYLRTLTTTYPNLDSWQWNPNSLLPMEFHSYFSLPSAVVHGIQAQTIDIAQLQATGGYSSVIIGDVLSGTDFGGFALNPGVWRDNHLIGYFQNEQLSQLDVATYSYYLPLDGQQRRYALGASPVFSLPDLANTGCPAGGAGCNWIANGGALYTSYWITLGIHSVLNGISDTPNAAFGLTYPNNARFNALIPANGINYILIDDGSGGAAPYLFWETDLTTFANNVSVTMQNPLASTLDINALFLTANNTEVPTATYLGWLYIYNDTQTFNGITMNGYAILVAPDFSQYVILNFLPVDATAQNWNDTGQAKQGKVDRSGQFIIKKFNSGTLLFAGSPVNGAAIPFPIKQSPPVNLAVNPGLYK